MDKFVSTGQEELEKLTGCKRSCRYRSSYKFHELMITEREMAERNEIWFDIILSKSLLKINTETPVFPLRSLIADIGGTLGLFLGFSFIMIWEGFEALIIFLKHQLVK